MFTPFGNTLDDNSIVLADKQMVLKVNYTNPVDGKNTVWVPNYNENEIQLDIHEDHIVAIKNYTFPDLNYKRRYWTSNTTYSETDLGELGHMYIYVYHNNTLIGTLTNDKWWFLVYKTFAVGDTIRIDFAYPNHDTWYETITTFTIDELPHRYGFEIGTEESASKQINFGSSVRTHYDDWQSQWSISNLQNFRTRWYGHAQFKRNWTDEYDDQYYLANPNDDTGSSWRYATTSDYVFQGDHGRFRNNPGEGVTDERFGLITASGYYEVHKTTIIWGSGSLGTSAWQSFDWNLSMDDVLFKYTLTRKDV